MCVGPVYNQSCLYKNLYYADSQFWILTLKGTHLPVLKVSIGAFLQDKLSPQRREFDSYNHLDRFVRNTVDPKIIPDVTVHFVQPWHRNIGHALFDGLYPAYVALIRFPPRHLRPFRLLLGLDNYKCENCWSEDVYSRFAGLGIIKANILDRFSTGRWFVFEELIMGSGNMCQRCIRPNLQLSGGVELDGARLFRDRMYKQHGLAPPKPRSNHSAERRNRTNPLKAYIIENKRFNADDNKEINAAIAAINKYTNRYINKTVDTITNLNWPLIQVSYMDYRLLKVRDNRSVHFNATKMDSQSPTYELIDNDFITQLRALRDIDIHVTGPGTGQMYQSFLSDGSVTINLGGVNPWRYENSPKAYTSFLEQYITAGTPYIKGLYYPINQRAKGIKKNQVVKLIRKAAKLIIDGFSLPVNPRENLAPDGQLFTEMCDTDRKFCKLVTERSLEQYFWCNTIWVEDIVHERRQWSVGGIMIGGKNIRCPFNRTLLHDLRRKYAIEGNTRYAD